jgi:hypothetical protein
MLRFNFNVMHINDLEWGGTETLHERSLESAYDAVVTCFDSGQKADFLEVVSRRRGAIFGEISPYNQWKTLEAFEDCLNTHILAAKIQLNMEICRDRAAEDLIIKVLDNERLASRSVST